MAGLCEAAVSDGVGPALDGVHHRLVDTIWRRLCGGASCTPGVSVSQVGRRYDINANLIFKWRRDPRDRPTEDGQDALSFLPVELVPEPASPAASDGRIEIALRSGHRVKGYVDRVEIALGAEIVARHRRSYVRGDVVYDPLHYLSLLEKKPGALDQAPLRGVRKGERTVPQHGARATLRLVRGLTRRARTMLHRLATEPSSAVRTRASWKTSDAHALRSVV